jgi:hypothetical protein
MLAADAVDLRHLAGAEALRGIEAPEPLHQPLPPEDFMAACDAAVKIVGDIEEGAVAIGDAGVEGQDVGRQGVLAARGLAHFELLDRARGPYRPVPKQAALEKGPGGDALVAQVERQHEIEQDVIVIAGVERDAIERAGGRHSAQYIERSVAVEWRDLDGDDVIDGSEAAPEIGAEDDASDRRLQVEADQRDFSRHRLAMRDDLVLGSCLHRREAEQARVVADANSGLRFCNGLLGRARQASDHGERPFAPACCRLRRQFQHRPVQPDVADRELRGVNADGESSGAGIEIITRQCALMPDIERALGVECERMRREHGAVGNQFADVGFDFAVMHERCSYPNSGPATANGSCAGATVAGPKRMR